MNESHVKNLGQVAAVVVGNKPPKATFVLWYNTNDNSLYYYNVGIGDWINLVGGISSAINIGDGPGQVLKIPIENNILELRTIKGVNGISVRISDTGKEILIGLTPKLVLKPSQTLYFGANVNSCQFLIIEANVQWRMNVNPSSIPWINLPQIQGNGDATIQVCTLQNNTSPNQRSASFLLEAVDGSVDPITITLIQEGQQSQAVNWMPVSTDIVCEDTEGNYPTFPPVTTQPPITSSPTTGTPPPPTTGPITQPPQYTTPYPTPSPTTGTPPPGTPPPGPSGVKVEYRSVVAYGGSQSFIKISSPATGATTQYGTDERLTVDIGETPQVLYQALPGPGYMFVEWNGSSSFGPIFRVSTDPNFLWTTKNSDFPSITLWAKFIAL